MTLIGHVVRLLAGILQSLGSMSFRLSNLLYGSLPALLTSSQLASLTRNHYHSVYTDRFISPDEELDEHRLALLETEIFDRYKIHAGRMLVLGCGWGRETIALAQRGVSVVGIDTNYNALRAARRLAKDALVQAFFLQADFLELPYAAASFDYVLLTYNMYSAIPGTACRQALVRDLGRIMKPHGLVILSFLREHHPTSRRKVVSAFLNRALSRLPGANPTYQPGDDCQGGHFFHAFQDEEEIRRELGEAGMLILELDWAREFSVVAYRPQHP